METHDWEYVRIPVLQLRPPTRGHFQSKKYKYQKQVLYLQPSFSFPRVGSMSEIKVLDAQKWFLGTAQERQEFAQCLREGFQTAGFVKLTNHGLSDKCIDEAFKWVSDIFKPLRSCSAICKYRPKDILNFLTRSNYKSQIPPVQSRREDGAVLEQRKPPRSTYQRTRRMRVLRMPRYRVLPSYNVSVLTHMQEHFDCGAPEDKMFPNVWPDAKAIEGFQPFIEDYFAQCQSISLGLMDALECGFNLPAGTFRSRFKENASELRLNHYPRIAAAKLADGTTNRIWPHTDFGIITLLLPDTVGGLEIWDTKTEEFVPVPARSRHEMIINTGDCLQRWTNDHIKAGLHRVVAPQLTCKDNAIVPERFSLAFFLKAARHESAGPLPFFVDESHPALYDEITTLDFQRKRTAQVY